MLRKRGIVCFMWSPRAQNYVLCIVWNCNVITCVELCAFCDQSCALYVVSVSPELCA